MYELGGAKQAGSTYAHGGPAGKRGRSLRAHRNFPSRPLLPPRPVLFRPVSAAEAAFNIPVTSGSSRFSMKLRVLM